MVSSRSMRSALAGISRLRSLDDVARCDAPLERRVRFGLPRVLVRELCDLLRRVALDEGHCRTARDVERDRGPGQRGRERVRIPGVIFAALRSRARW